MQYISGYYALNIPCPLDTTGDWHQSCLPWDKVNFADSESSPFGDWGIEKDVYVYPLKGRYNVANHIRACLDFIDKGKYTHAQGMREDYIGNDKYNADIFGQVYKLKALKTPDEWKNITSLMEKEYRLDWVNFLASEGEKMERTEIALSSDHEMKKVCMLEFLRYLNKHSNKYILNGGTALMYCYDSDRYSDNIDLDSKDADSVLYIVEAFCKEKSWSYRTEESGSMLKFSIRYANRCIPFEVKISLRKSEIPTTAYMTCNDIKVYDINNLAALKLSAFVQRDTIRDFYDCVFIVNNYYDKLSFTEANNFFSCFHFKYL